MILGVLIKERKEGVLLLKGSVMKDFEFMATFGTEQKTVHITNSGNQIFEIRIDNGYQGLILKTNNRWIANWSTRSLLGTDDIEIIGDIIEKNMNE